MDDPRTVDDPRTPDGDALVGRDAELDRLFRTVDREPSADQVLVLAGDAGTGKTALLDAAVRRARTRGVRVLRAEGSEPEARLAFSGLHQLLRPVLDGLERLPDRQRAALSGAFGLETTRNPDPGTDPAPGPDTGAQAGAPDRMLTGLAVLTLLSDLGERGPLLLVLDDAQWLDRASLDALAFAARRLDAEPVTLLAGVRAGEPLPGFGAHWPPLVLGPLDAAAAGRLLDLQPRRPTGRARTRVLDQAQGNPLALAVLARAATDADGATAGPYAPVGATGAGPLPLTDHLERVFAARLAGLPGPTTRALLLLAAVDTADAEAVVRAGLPGTDDPAWRPAEEAGLVRATGRGIRFRHPLMRSAAYHAAPAAARRTAHLALAETLHDEPDRRAWHLAAAAYGPDADVAAALERTADRARRRGGHAAAAQALQRAAELAPERADSARLLVAAAADAVLTGDLPWVDELVATACERTDDAPLLAAATLYAGRLAAFTARHTVVFARLTRAAEQWAATQPSAALDLLAAAAVVCFYSGEDAQRQQIRRLLERLPGDGPYAWPHLWIRALADPYEDRAERAALLPRLLAGAERRPERLTSLAVLAWLLDETPQAVRAFDEADAHWRARGALPEGLGGAAAWAYVEHGRWEQAREVCRQVTAGAALAGLDHAVACAASVDAVVLAFRGETAAARARADDALALIDPAESRTVAVYVRRALAAAAAAEGAYETAYDQLRTVFTADGEPAHYHVSHPALAELAAAAVHSGHDAHRTEAVSIVERAARRLGDGASPRLRALIARARALLAAPEDAETHFRTALSEPALERRPFEHAQTQLDYAEWLRRRRRITEARPLLTAALETFVRLGARPWAERARAESRAAGLDLADARPDALAVLSPQQREIIALAARGLTNREIGEKLYLSPRTVSSHLYRSFPKLGVTGRAQLRDLVEPGPPARTPVRARS
ncbi:ATP-binding protein [Streptomyces armeniacus]|uniref:ATP-binding protein n=1 Tax=Streptomyces armeniacus TaxID=83291 RepID=UPI003CCC5B0D